MSDGENNYWGSPNKPPSLGSDPTRIGQHLEWFIEPARDFFLAKEALFELAFGPPDGGPHHARLFRLDEVDLAVRFASTENNKGNNFYLNCTLLEGTADRNKRSSAADFLASTVIVADVDENYNEVQKRMKDKVGNSMLTVITGNRPQRRSQHWFRLNEPCVWSDEHARAVDGLVYHIGADPKAKGSNRLRRLGGTVNWPSSDKKARGYVAELTTLIFEQAAELHTLEFFQTLTAGGSLWEYTGGTSNRPAGPPNEIVRDGMNMITDGRETWFRNLVYAMMASFQSENGCDPRIEDIAPEALRIFAQRCDTRDGRWTQGRLMHRIENTFRRFDGGRLELRPIGQPQPADAPPFEWGQRLNDKAIGPQIKADTVSDAEQTTVVPKLKTLRELFKEYVPPDFVIEGVIQKGYLYTITGRSGHGKTVCFIRIGMDVALGNPIGPHNSEKCNVAFFAGENPALVTNRLIILCEKENIAADDVPFYTYSDTFKLDVGYQRVIEDAERIGGFGLIIVDTFSAYCRENNIEENDNNAMGKWVKDVLRHLTHLPGNPCVVALSHPNRSSGKTASSKEELIPRGAYATLGEVDGNITVWREGNAIEIDAHSEKFRGPPFQTIKMKMISALSDKYKDTKGKPMNEIYSAYTTDEEIEKEEERNENTDLTILRAMEDFFHEYDEWPSSREISDRCAISHVAIGNRQRFMASQKGLRLVAKTRRTQTAPYKLTKAGEEYLREIEQDRRSKFIIET